MEENYVKLYDITKPFSEDRIPLYFQGDFKRENEKIYVDAGKTLDLGTYFNAFSLKKWMDYTNISSLKIELNLNGKFSVEIFGADITGEEKISTYETDGDFSHSFSFDEMDVLTAKFDMIFVKLNAKEKGEFLGGAYYGEFSALNDIHIGITICTFKREKYLLPNLEKLATLTAKNPNYSVMVVDNGNTLEEKDADELKILHNPNYGGSGGFTRGIMEQINAKKATHILLTDDDVMLELSVFDRLYAYLRGLKSEHSEKFFAGAMLSIEKPTMQTENTGLWNKINGKSFGKGFILTDRKTLCANEYPTKGDNAFAGWWFCAVPVKAVEKIGYPLPIFIKGDDIEYGARNDKEILTLNGVSVWHETFQSKLSPAIQYFGDRNMLLMIHLMKNVGRGEFLLAVAARIVRWLNEGSYEGVRMLEYALKDLSGGFEKITEIPADKKFAEVRAYSLDKNLLASVFSTLTMGFKYFLDYNAKDKKIKAFVKEKLQDQKFWRNYLQLDGGR